MNKTDSRLLAEIAISISLASVLSQIRIFTMPYGGSVTMGSMIPILLVALRRDLKVGLTTGAIYGLIQILLDGMIYHPVSMFLDFPLAFGVIGFVALFKKRPMVGTVVVFFLRFLSHFTSGVVFWWMYAPEGMSPIVYSAIYNGGYIFAEMVISLIFVYALIQRNVLDMDL